MEGDSSEVLVREAKARHNRVNELHYEGFLATHTYNTAKAVGWSASNWSSRFR